MQMITGFGSARPCDGGTTKWKTVPKKLEALQKFVPFAPVHDELQDGMEGAGSGFVIVPILRVVEFTLPPGILSLPGSCLAGPPEKLEVRYEGFEAGHAACRRFDRAGASRQFPSWCVGRGGKGRPSHLSRAEPGRAGLRAESFGFDSSRTGAATALWLERARTPLRDVRCGC